MSMLEKCPNEIFHMIACNMAFDDMLSFRLVCSRVEVGLRSYITHTHFSTMRVPFSEDGLQSLVRKTRCQCFTRELRSITIRFCQMPLFYLDSIDSSKLKVLHQNFFASWWHDGEPRAATILRRLNHIYYNNIYSFAFLS